MIKWTIRIFLILVAITVFTLFYLSFYGLETDYFNSTIQNKVKTINPNFDLEFQKTNILLDLKKLELKVSGITTQRNFLKNLGIMDRVEIVSKNLSFMEKANIYYRINKLIDKKFMGEIFKVMLLTNHKTKFNIGFKSD